jgi:microcompartment protein CcmK/EutM
MILGIVVGTVVSSSKDEQIQGARYLLVEKCNQRGQKNGDYIVALDAVGAGREEMVIVSEGSTARETQSTNGKPIDALIVGIIDIIDENETIVYKK